MVFRMVVIGGGLGWFVYGRSSYTYRRWVISRRQMSRYIGRYLGSQMNASSRLAS